MRSILTATAFSCLAALAACASGNPKPKESVGLELTIHALPTVNPDDRGRASPIVVRVYELKDDGAFKAADFFTLQNQDKTVLADDVIKRDRFELRPGEHQTLARKIDPAATAIGVIAAYRDLPKSVWRAVYPIPAAPNPAWYRFSTPKLKLTADIDTNAIKFLEPTQ